MKKLSKFLVLVAAGLLVVTSCTTENSSSSEENISSSEIANSSSSSSSSSENTSSSSSSISSEEKKVPTLTQEMFDVFDTEYISFDGTDEIALYDIRTGKYVESYYYTVATAMNGTYWTATYLDGGLGTNRTMFFKNHEGLACEVSVNLMNEENYIPALDDHGKTITWENSGMKNYLNELEVSDFEYKKETGRYHYKTPSDDLAQNIVSSANPYDFIVDDLSLIITDDEIIGINASSKFDTTISAGHKAEQTLIATINYGEDIVEVDTITKFKYDAEHHDLLASALTKMRNLTSYKTKVKFYTQTIYSQGITAEGYFETITPTDLYFEELKAATTSNPTDEPIANSAYGYHKFSDTEYNAYYTQQVDATTYALTASRAYKGTIKDVQPTFAFAPEIMTSVSYDEDTGETYYYSDVNMSNVATTFYSGLGNDINMYGIFATIGYTSDTEGFTPYVVVNSDGYISYACFYFNLGLMYGVAEISYSDFDSASLPEGTEISFTKKEIPSSWNDLTIIKSTESTSTDDDVEINAGDFLKEFFNDENILDSMPFFGGVDYLGDAYGFGMTNKYRPEGMSFYVDGITLYYDVPLDLNYSIETSLNKVHDCLVDNGFINMGNDVYVKGDITIVPVDNELDLMIYIYRTSDYKIV